MKWCIRLILLLTSILCIRHYFQKNKQASAFQEDVRYFFDALRKYHPAPYRHISQDSLLRLETEMLNECHTFPNRSSFNLRLMQCNQFLDYHSNVHFNANHLVGKSIKETLQRDKIIKDLPLYIRHDTLFLTPERPVLQT